MKKLLVLALALLMPLTTLAAPVRAPKGFAGKVFANTLSLWGTFNAHTVHLCTIAPYEKIDGGYRLITAGHCTQGTPSKIEYSVSLDNDTVPVPVTLVKERYDHNYDFAVFELKTESKLDIAVFDPTAPRVGDHTVDVHFALGLAKQLSNGIVTSQNFVPSKIYEDGCGGDFLVQMYAGAGASGSLVYSARTHKAIAITIAEYDDPVGFLVEPISKFYIFMAMPTQPHRDDYEDDGTDVN